MPPKNTPAEVARLVISELEHSDLLSNIVEKAVEKSVKKAVKEAIAGLVTRLEEQEGRVLELEGQVRAHTEEIKRLTKSEESCRDAVSRLERKADLQEQHSRRNNLRIHGIKERPQESTDDEICRLADQLGFKISAADIDRSYRVSAGGGNGNGAAVDRSKDRPIVVQFGAYRTRAKFTQARSKLKGTGVYINEDLTAANQKLYHKVRHSVKVLRAWSIDGRIFAGMKDSHGGFIKKLVTCEADIAKL